jgi:hypothetical protein
LRRMTRRAMSSVFQGSSSLAQRRPVSTGSAANWVGLFRSLHCGHRSPRVVRLLPIARRGR